MTLSKPRHLRILRPLATATECAPEAALDEAETAQPVETTPIMRIVVVDDRLSNRNILLKLSRSVESEAVTESFEDANQALEWIEEHASEVDLVITDFKMPGLSGAEFVRACHTRVPGFDAPVVVVTAYEDRKFRYEALEAGAADFLLSPIDPREFHTRIRHLLTLRKQQRLIKSRASSLEQALTSARLRHAETVAASEHKLRLVIDSNPSLIVTTTADGWITLANRAFAEAWGWSPDDLIGRQLSDGAPDPVFAKWSLAADAEALAATGAQATVEQPMTTAQGKEIYLQVTKVPIVSSPSEPPEILTVATDITRRREIERELSEAKRAEEISNRSKTEFLANMSHELRTPLNAILGFADVMRMEMFGRLGHPRYQEYAGDVKASAEHLLRVISDILDVSQIEAGKLVLRESTVDVAQLVADVRRLVEHRAEERGVALRTEISTTMPALRGDEAKLKQVLVNLVVNALKFTPLGGRVDVMTDLAPDGGIRFVIEDTGIGMTDEQIEIAMARFGRSHGRRMYKNSGAGLGLPLSIDLMRLHGGWLDISSVVGRGTRVVIRFPPERTVIGPTTPHPPSRPDAGGGAGAGSADTPLGAGGHTSS